MGTSFRIVTVSVVAALLFGAGCDAGPGAASFENRLPVVSEFSLSPQQIDFDQVPEEWVEGVDDEQLHVPLELSLTTRDPDGEIDRVTYIVQSPTSSTESLIAGTLTPVGNDRYEASTTLVLPLNEAGAYPVVVHVIDDRQHMTQVRGMIQYRRVCQPGGEPPVVESVEADPEVVDASTEQLTLVATVSDPDGLGDIQRVEGDTPSGFNFEMFDDGESSGDEEAGDGRYTATFDVGSATPGVQTFTIRATDWSCLTSEEVEIDITIEG